MKTYTKAEWAPNNVGVTPTEAIMLSIPLGGADGAAIEAYFKNSNSTNGMSHYFLSGMIYPFKVNKVVGVSGEDVMLLW